MLITARHMDMIFKLLENDFHVIQMYCMQCTAHYLSMNVKAM